MKTIHIESLALQDMVKKDFTPALFTYASDISQEVLRKKELLPSLPATYEETIVTTLTGASEEILTTLKRLEKSTDKAEETEDALTTAKYYHDRLLEDMNALRTAVDQAEALIPGSYLPYPTYDELLFSLR